METVLCKHYMRIGAANPSARALLFGVHLHVNDVRSGYRDSVEGLFEAPYLDESGLGFSRGMVQPVDPGTLQEVDPLDDSKWPDSADEKILHYFLNFQRFTILRNYRLNLYAWPNESPEDFRRRCLAEVLEDRNRELAQIRDLHIRRFLEVEQRLLAELTEGKEAFHGQESEIAKVRETFLLIRDRFSRCILKDDLVPLDSGDLDWVHLDHIESQERLSRIRSEFLAVYNQLNRKYCRQVDSVETYEVPLKRTEVEILSRAILWS